MANAKTARTKVKTRTLWTNPSSPSCRPMTAGKITTLTLPPWLAFVTFCWQRGRKTCNIYWPRPTLWQGIAVGCHHLKRRVKADAMMASLNALRQIKPLPTKKLKARMAMTLKFMIEERSEN